MGVPLVIIHFRLGFSRSQKHHPFGASPIFGNPKKIHLELELYPQGEPRRTLRVPRDSDQFPDQTTSNFPFWFGEKTIVIGPYHPNLRALWPWFYSCATSTSIKKLSKNKKLWGKKLSCNQVLTNANYRNLDRNKYMSHLKAQGARFDEEQGAAIAQTQDLATMENDAQRTF